MFLSSNSTVMRSSKNKAQGSALVIAIFVIIVMSLLGVALVKMLSSTAESVAYEVIGTRAFQTAQTGLQWGLSDRFPLNSSARHCDGASVDATAANYVSTGPLSGSLDASSLVDIDQATGSENCVVTAVKCDDFKHEGVTYFTLTSTGQCTVADVVTSRTIEVTARTLQ